MRKCFIDTIVEQARKDESIALLMAEVGFSVVEPFEKEFPNRFFNVGIAEQDLVTIAAGMALKGAHPIAYSMSAFLGTRAYEMIKCSVCYQNLPVVFVSNGTGLSYGNLGSTHHAIEESAVLRSIPNLHVEFPGNAAELRGALEYALSSDSPFFISYPKVPAPQIEGTYEHGKAVRYKEGRNGTILAFGYNVMHALEASEQLKNKGLEIGVYGFHTVKPLDREAICVAAKSGNIFVLDEHSSAAGIGGEVARIILENKININNYYEFSVPDCFQPTVAGYHDLLEMYSMSPKKIASEIERQLLK